MEKSMIPFCVQLSLIFFLKIYHLYSLNNCNTYFILFSFTFDNYHNIGGNF
jgi:hypothetical protein